MHSKKNAIVIRLAVLALLVAAPMAVADDEVQGEVVPGLNTFFGDSDPNSAKFLQYREVPNGFVGERFWVSWEPGEKFYLDLDSTDIGQDDMQVHFKIGGRDRWKPNVDWVENPRRYSDNAYQLHAYQGDGVFTLPDGLQQSMQDAWAAGNGDAATCDSDDPACVQYILKNAAEQGSQNQDLMYQRNVGSMELSYTPTEKVTVGVTARRQTRSGTQADEGAYYPFGGRFGAEMGSSEFAAPVNYQTDDASIFVEYAGEKVTAGAKYFASEFTADEHRLLWDTAQFLDDTWVVPDEVAAPGHGQKGLATDHEMQKWVVYAAGNLPGRTRISGTFSQSRTTQDDPFLPMTVNSLLEPLAGELPRNDYDGEYRNNLYNIRLTSNPSRWVGVRAWWRMYEQDNKSPSLTFEDQIIADYEHGDTRRTLPYSYDKTQYGFDVSIFPTRDFDFTLGYERVDWSREYAAVTDSSDDVYTFKIDWDVTDILFLRGRYTYSERRADHYYTHYFEESFPDGEAPGAVNEGERRFYWTDRDRNRAKLMFEVTPTPIMSIYGNWDYYDSDYKDPNTGQSIGQSYDIEEDRDGDTIPESYDILIAGRESDKGSSYSLGLSFDVVDTLSLYTDYTWTDDEYKMYSRYRSPGSDNPLDNWWSEGEDEYRTWMLGWNWQAKPDVLVFRGDVTWTEGKSNISTDFIPGGNPSSDTGLTQFPEIKSELTVAKLWLDWSARQNLIFGFGYWYENWDYEDWAQDYMQVYMGDPGQDSGGSASEFSHWLATGFDDYENNIFMVRMTYRF